MAEPLLPAHRSDDETPEKTEDVVEPDQEAAGSGGTDDELADLPDTDFPTPTAGDGLSAEELDRELDPDQEI